MCNNTDQFRFRLEDTELLPDITQWVVSRIDQGYDMHWDLRGDFLIWICVPGTEPDLMEFLGVWGNNVTADSRR